MKDNTADPETEADLEKFCDSSIAADIIETLREENEELRRERDALIDRIEEFIARHGGSRC